MELAQPLPWHDAQWTSIQQRRTAQRLPHALMLTGPAGVGKEQFAARIAAALLCARPDANGEACGACAPCQLFRAGTHPDLRWVAPEEEGKAVRIDAIRDLIAYLSLTSQFGGYKIAVVTPAERMNSAAANALLKTLEEPAPQTLLVLVCARPGALPPTVRSRCQIIGFGVPDQAQALSWLRQQGVESPETALEAAGGAPLKAREFAVSGGLQLRTQLLEDLQRLADDKGDPIGLAAHYHGQDGRVMYSWLLSYVTDMIRLAMMPGPAGRRQPDSLGHLARLAQGRNPTHLFQYRDDLLNALWMSDTQVNAQLLMEDLFVRWSRLVKR